MELLGHSSTHIMMNIYAHVLEESKRRLAARMAACSATSDVNCGCQRGGGDLGTAPEQLLRRQDSNLDHRNQNPRCCLYTTADERAETHGHMVT
jgi:hypothetical protein